MCFVIFISFFLSFLKIELLFIYFKGHGDFPFSVIFFSLMYRRSAGGWRGLYFDISQCVLPSALRISSPQTRGREERLCRRPRGGSCPRSGPGLALWGPCCLMPGSGTVCTSVSRLDSRSPRGCCPPLATGAVSACPSVRGALVLASGECAQGQPFQAEQPAFLHNFDLVQTLAAAVIRLNWAFQSVVSSSGNNAPL